MHRTLTLLATAAFALSLAGAADAMKGGAPYSMDAKGNCHDSAGKMAKKAMCAAPAAPTAATPMASAAPMAAAGGPNCKKGKRCGNACISVKDVCHK
jgi:hypothetical protein